MLEKKLQLLEDIFGSYYSTSNRSGVEFLFFCPKCQHHKKKLSINIDKDCFKCWVCGWSSKSIGHAVALRGTQQQINTWMELTGKVDFSTFENEAPVEEQVRLPKEFITLTSKKSGPIAIQAKQYLFSRGITFHDIVWWKMGFCPKGKYENRIVIPSFDMRGNVNYFVARSFKEHQVPYLNPAASKDLIFNELYLDWTKDITLVEGVFDAVVSGNSIPLLGSTLREESHIFQQIAGRCSKVFMALDPDAKEKEKQIIKLLTSYGIEVWKINVKPYKDVGSMTREIFLQRKKESIQIDSDNDLEYIIRTMNE